MDSERSVERRRDSLLARHPGIGERVTCRLCGVSFSRKDNLRRHVRYVHKVNPPEAMTQQQQPQPSTSGEGRGVQARGGNTQAPSTSAEGSPPAEVQPSSQSKRQKKMHTCLDCASSFTRGTTLKLHQMYHCPVLRELEYGCPELPPPSPASGGEASPPSTITTGPPFTTDHRPSPPPPPPPSSSPSPLSSPLSSDVRSSDGRSSDGFEAADLPDDLAPEGFEEVETSFRGRLKTYRLREEASTHVSIPEFLVKVYEDVVNLLHRALTYVTAIKSNLWLDCEFANVHGQTCRRAFKTKNVAVLRSTDTEELVGELFQKLVDEKEACEMKGSGWSFVRVVDMEIRLNVYQPLGGSSYIPIPAEIESRKAVKNVLNLRDQNCFAYSVLARHVEDYLRRPLTAADFTPEVRARSGLDFTGLEFPVRIEQIALFERTNGVSVNVYGLDQVWCRKTQRYTHLVYPLRITKHEELHPDHFDLLFLTNDETTHYALITDFNRLVRHQLTRHHGQIYVCKRCFAHFDERPVAMGLGGAQRLAEHRRYCAEHAPLRTDVSDRKHIRFDKPERSQRVRFTVYADFECALEPYDGNVPQEPPPTVPAPDLDPATVRGELPHHHRYRAADAIGSQRVRTTAIHKPYAYAYYIQDNHRTGDPITDGGNTLSEFRLYRGRDAARHFMLSMKEDVRRIAELLYDRRRVDARLTPDEEASFQSATACHICKGAFTGEEGDVKVRDHQHSPPYRYRGAAHRLCNLRFKEQDAVHCYFHNLSAYDAHFVVRELGIDKGDVKILANNEEKYITFTKYFKHRGAGRHNRIAVRFLDSYRFLSRGLATLVSLLPTAKMLNTRFNFPDQAQFDLVRRKGVFPYEYVTSPEVLEERVLPPRESFHNSLRKEDITAEEYAHAQAVWAEFRCETLGDYADIYLKTDVLLLADVFEAFRDMCLEHYGLDPAHWLTLPSYAWDVMLFKTGVTLDTLQDVDMYLFFEKGVRGGLVQCVTRHAVADNKFTRGDFGGGEVATARPHADRSEGEYIMYFDANNLYGWAMSQPLPFGDFQWLSREEIDVLDVANVPADGEYGYVLEADIEYPRDHDLHDRHRDLPFLPEFRKAPAEFLPYPEDVLRDFNVGKNKKLMVTLFDKSEYVVHYRLLQQALENGLRIRRVHRVLRFKQSPWLKPYVAMNTELRRLANNKFEVELFKLMVNAVYGMSLQNVRKHVDIRVSTNTRSYTRLVAKSNFSDRAWLKRDLALVHMRKVRVVLDKPVYAGMCILDHSKWWMYRFHYMMQARYGLDKIQLLYMDTDSLIYKILTIDVYDDMKQYLDDFDTSNYPRDHTCFDGRNAKVLGKFKDEAGGVIIAEFVGLMAKLYCIDFFNPRRRRQSDPLEIADVDGDGPPPIKRAKGVNKAVVDHCLTVADYRRCLQQHAVRHTVNDRFQSRRHIIYSVTVEKRSLAPYDDKRYVVPEDGVNTLPWGHYAIPLPPP